MIVIGRSSQPRQSRACHRCGKRHSGSHRRRSRALKKVLSPLGPRLLGASQQVKTAKKTKKGFGWRRISSSPAPEIQPAAKMVSSSEPRVALAPASALRTIAARMPVIRRFLPKRSG